MKNNSDFKKVFKVLVIGFVLFSSIYVLYFYNNTSRLENFGNCTTCKMNPSNNKCKPIYNISYNWNPQKKTINVNNVETDHVFCEWEPNCDYNTMESNYLTQEQRLELSNSQLKDYYNSVN